MTDSPIRIVIPIDVIDDEIPSPVEVALVTAQRGDWHVDMPDAAFTALATRSVYPRPSLKTEDNGLALALAALAGCDVVDVIHDLDGTDSGACAPDCSGCSMESAPEAAPWCQWCGEAGHVLTGCAALAARLRDGGAR